MTEEGFTLDTRPKAPPANTRDTHNTPSKSYVYAAPRSAAAVRRANLYQAPIPNVSASLYKQSCLPMEDRDPVLLKAERSKGIKLPKDSFKPGTIIRTVLHEPDFQGVAGATLTLKRTS